MAHEGLMRAAREHMRRDPDCFERAWRQAQHGATADGVYDPEADGQPHYEPDESKRPTY